VTDLGTLDGHTASYASSINASGQVVGRSPPIIGERAFVWQNGAMSGLAALTGAPSAAYGINDAGTIVGWAPYDYGNRRGFIYTDGSVTRLGTLGGATGTAYGINNFGHVVGSSDLAVGGVGGFLWDGSTMTDVGTLGGTHTEAYAINDAGLIVGYSDTGNGSHAFLWQDGAMTDLGTLGGWWSFAKDINDAGQIVGYSDKGLLDGAAFLWQDGAMTDLGTLGGWWAEAAAVNNAGQIVGSSHTGELTADGDSIYHAFIYDNGVMTDLNGLLTEGSGWELTAATGINDAGRIVGWGTLDGAERAFLLDFSSESVTTIPEPASLTLVLIGGMGLWLKKRRNRG